MSQEQQFLNPSDQDKLFQKLKDAGLLSQDQGQSTSTEDSDAQSGIGNVDFGTLQSLIKHASNPNAVPMQEGDKMHPMDAISQISGQMNGPAAPSGVSLTGGPKVVQNASKDGLIPRLLGLKTAGNSIQTAAPGILPTLFGMKVNTPAGDNYYAAAKQAGIDKFLPQGLPQMPDGTPFVGSEALTHAMNLQKTVYGQGNQTYTSKDQLMSQGIPEDIANKLMAANPSGVTNKEVSNYMGNERIKSSDLMAQSRATMAGVAKLGQALKVGGFDAAQPMAEKANTALGAITRAQQLIDQITASGGTAIQSQRAELAKAVAAISANGTGVVTDDSMNQFMPQSAKAKFGNFTSYWTNENQPIDFSGFLPQMQDLLTREKQANQGISNAASQLGINIMSGTGQPNQAAIITKARAQSPIVSSNTPMTVPTNPNPPQQAPNLSGAPQGLVRVRNLQTGQTGRIAPGYDTTKYAPL